GLPVAEVAAVTREREPLRVTLTRTVAIAAIAGAVLASRWGGISRWPLTSVVMLWPSLGGHYVELAYLDVVRPRLSGSRAVQVLARIAVWFIGGALMLVGMRFTALALHAPRHLPLSAWWIGGLVFIGVELVAHLALHARGRPSFYTGRG
ncbi:MAG TPA: hypothetical protein VF488_06145, partial [Gemmatimonadaceae bacterium]